MKTIWYVEDTSLKMWLKLHSGLKASYFPVKHCAKCGREHEAKPFVRGDHVGVELDDCPCGKKGSWVMTPRSKKGQKKAREQFNALMSILVED